MHDVVTMLCLTSGMQHQGAGNRVRLPQPTQHGNRLSMVQPRLESQRLAPGFLGLGQRGLGS